MGHLNALAPSIVHIGRVARHVDSDTMSAVLAQAADTKVSAKTQWCCCLGHLLMSQRNDWGE